MAATVLFSYSHIDEALRDQIETQLAMLKRQGVIETWHDRRIGAGEDFADAIDRHVESDDIILLLVSSDFLASDYCYNSEMKRAMERHERGDAVVIPVILRACDWHEAPFGRLNATPPDGKPITQYADRDQALLEVAKAVRAAAGRLAGKFSPKDPKPAAAPAARTERVQQEHPPRSSNLALSKTFGERDKDRFKHESFEYIARFFENSLDELARRNDSIDGDFRRVDANQFTATIYRSGQAVSRCTVFLGDRFAAGIAYSTSENFSRNSYNEILTVGADDQSVFLRSMGVASIGQGNEAAKLTQEGAAELYWGMLIGPLQPRQ
jgi:TIR domain